MIEGSVADSSTPGVVTGASTSVVTHPRPAVNDMDRRPGYVVETQPRSIEMTSTMSTTNEFRVESDPPTLQIRDQRRGLTRGKESSLGRTPSPDTSVMSSESDVTPSMRMEKRQKRRIIEEVAVYDTRTFYENQSTKRSRHRGDTSPGPAVVHREPAVSVEHQAAIEVSSAAVHIEPEPTPSTSTSTDQPSRTFAVTGSIQVPEDIDKVDTLEQRAPVVVSYITPVMVSPSDTVSVTQGTGTNTSVTYVVHHSLPGKMSPGDILVRSNETPYRDLRTDLAEYPSIEKKKGKMKSGDYGPILETVTYVVCYQVPGEDERSRNVINELHRPNYTITGRVGPTSSIEDTAESYTIGGLSGGPPPYSEEQESLYLAILNYAARSQDNWQREVPVSVSYITQQDFSKAIDSNTLSLSRKGPTLEKEASPPPTPTADDEEVWVKRKVVVVEPVRTETELPTTTTADVFSEAMTIVQQADIDVDVRPPTTSTSEYRGWRRDDEVEVKQTAADVVPSRYQIEVRADVTAADIKEPVVAAAEVSPIYYDDVVTTSVSRPDDTVLYVTKPSPVEISSPEMKEVSVYPDSTISTTRAYVFHEQLPTTVVQSSGTEPLSRDVEVATAPVSTYVQVTAAGSDTVSRTYVVHRDWPSLKAEQTNLDVRGRQGTLAEALGADSSRDVSTATYVVHYDWPTTAKPAVAVGTEGEVESVEVGDTAELRAASSLEDVPHTYVVHHRESPPPKTAPRYAAAETDVGVKTADVGREVEAPVSPENVVSHVYIVRRDWPQLKVQGPEVGQDVNVRLGIPSDIGPAPTGDMTMMTYVVHYDDWPVIKPAVPIRQRPGYDIISVPKPTSVTEAGETEVTVAAAAPSVSEVSQSYTVQYDLPATTVAVSTPKPRVTFAPTPMETNLDLVSPPSPDVETTEQRTYEVKYDLRTEKEVTTVLAAPAAAEADVEIEPAEERVPKISVAAAGPDEGSYRVETTYDSEVERDWPWFKADSPAIRQVTKVPDVPPSVAVEVSRGVGFYVDTSTEVPLRELTSKTYIVRQNWPELKLEMASRVTRDTGLADALMADKYRGDIATRTYVVNWPPVKTKAAVKDGAADTAVDINASTSADDDEEMSPTYLARLDRSRVKIHLPGPDKSREAEVEVIPAEPDDEPGVLSPPDDNLVTHTYIVHHDWPRVRLLLSEPKTAITDDDLFTSRQLDMVTYIVHCDWPSRKTKKTAKEEAEIFTVEPPDTGVDLSVHAGAVREFEEDVDLQPHTVDERLHVSVCPPELRHVELERPAVEVVTAREPEVRLRLETDIDEVLDGTADDFVVQYDLPAVKFQPELEPIHVRQPAVVVVPVEPEVERRPRINTDVVLPCVEPTAVVAADEDIRTPVMHTEEDTEPPSITVIAPPGDVVTRTYIVNHDWPSVKLTLSEPKRRLDSGPQVRHGVETDRELVSRTYIVHYDWPSLKVKTPKSTRIDIEGPDSGPEVAVRGDAEEPLPSVVFHYDVPSVDIEELEDIDVPEPSVEVTATKTTDSPDEEVVAIVPVPPVSYDHGDLTLSREAGEQTSHTYIVHHDWPHMKLTLPEPKRSLAVANVDFDNVPGTLERKIYIVHYDWPSKKTKVVIPRGEAREEQPETSTLVVCPVPPPSAVETVDEHPGEGVAVTSRAVGEEVPGVVEPAAITVFTPSVDVNTHTYVVHHDWPRVKLTLSQPKRTLDTGLYVDTGAEANRELISKTYVVHYDWPLLKVQEPVSGPSTKIVVEQLETEGKVTEPREAEVETCEPVPSVVFHYDVPSVDTSVDIQEPEPWQLREPSIKMISTETADTSDVPAEAAVAVPEVTYIYAGHEADVTLSGEVTPSGELTSHTYIVHHDWPRVKLTLPEPKRTLAVPGGGVGDVTTEFVSGTVERNTYIVHYNWPKEKTKTVTVIPEHEATDQPQPSTVALHAVPVAVTDEVSGEETVIYVVEYQIRVPKGKEQRMESAEVAGERPEVALPEVTGGAEVSEPAVAVVAPFADTVTHTYIVHNDWPRVKLTLPEPKGRLDSGFQTEAQAGTDRQLVSRTYIIHHDWPSLSVEATRPPKPTAKVGIEEVETRTEMTVRGEEDVDAAANEPLPSVVVQYEVVTTQEPEPIQIPEPTVKVITEPETSVEVPLRSEVDVDVNVTVDEPYPSSVAQHDFVPTVYIEEPEQIRIPEPVVQTVAEPQPGVDLRIRYETDVGEIAVEEPAIPLVGVTYVDEDTDKHAEPAIAVVAHTADIIHTYIVHRDWPKVKLTLSEPKAKLDVVGLAEEVPSHKVLSLTYVVHWPSLTGKPVPQAEAEVEVQQPTVPTTEPSAVEIRVDEEPTPSTDFTVYKDVEVPDVEVVSVAPAVTEAGEEEVVPATVSVSVAAGDTDSHTYIVHHDWPRMKLMIPEPKRPIVPATEDADTERISRTYIVHYDWPAMGIKISSKPKPPAEAAVQAVESGIEEPKPSTDIQVHKDATVPDVDVETTLTTSDVPAPAITVTGEEEIVPVAATVSVATGDRVSHTYIVHHDWPRVKLVVPTSKKPIAPAAEEDTGADKISRTYIVHYDWPSGKVKVERQPTAGEMEMILKDEPKTEPVAVDVVDEQREITQPPLPEPSVEVSQPEEPVLVETVLVSEVDVGEPELNLVPAGEEKWQLPVPDIIVEPPTVETEAEAVVVTEITDVDVDVKPIPVVTTVDVPSAVVETTPIEQPVSGETLTFIINYELIKRPVKVAQAEAASAEVEAPKAEEISKELLVKEPLDENVPETITYVVTYDVSKKEAGKPTKMEITVERRRSSVEEVPGAEIEQPQAKVTGVEAAVGAGEPSAEVLVVTAVEPELAPETPQEETVKYVVEYQVEVVKGKPAIAFRKKVTEVPSHEIPAERPSRETEAGVIAEDRGIPVQKQISEISETVNVDYEVVKIAAPAVLLEGDIEAPGVTLATREEERLEVTGPDVPVVQPFIELESREEIVVVKPPSLEGISEVGKVVPPDEVALERKNQEFDISVQPLVVEIPTMTAEMRAEPQSEVELEVPPVEKVQEMAIPPETEKVTFIVHYEETTIGAKPSPMDDVTISLKKQRTDTDEIRILFQPLHEPLAADDVTSAVGFPSLRHVVVVAIDIGTTFSGYAFTLSGKTHVKDRQDEDGEQQLQKQKHSTSKVYITHSLTH